MNNEDVGFAGFIPLILQFIIMGLVFGFTLKAIAKRKGRSKWGWFFVGFVPGWNIAGGYWLASLPDISVTEAISSLVNELKKYEFSPKPIQPSEGKTQTLEM